MCKWLLAAVAAVMVSSCAAMLDDAYDDQARRECDQGAHDRSGCYDRVDQHRRERERNY